MLIGKAHVYGDNINTDLIIAGKYTKSIKFKDFANHCLEDMDPEFIHRVRKGDLLVVGDNFGCGSSREQAPLALKHVGISIVLAKSYARIFYRNSINIGLPVLICDTTGIKTGDLLTVDVENGEIVINGTDVRETQKLPKIMWLILEKGGPYKIFKGKWRLFCIKR